MTVAKEIHSIIDSQQVNSNRNSLLFIMSNQEIIKSLNNGAQTSDMDLSENSGYPNLDPIWIQPGQIQQITDSYSTMTFNPSFGLTTVLPHQQPALSPQPTRMFHHQPQSWSLGDSDLVIPLPESIINNINPNQFPAGLDNITSVSDTTYFNPGQHSRQLPLTKVPQKIHPRDQYVARHRRTQAFQRQNFTDPASVPDHLRPKIIKEVINQSVSNQFQPQLPLINPSKGQGEPDNKIDHRRAPKVTQKKAKVPASKKLPYQQANKATQTIFDDEVPLFHRKEFNRIYAYLKRLDTTQPLFATPPYQALKVAQERQQYLQACNVIIANVNKKESTDIFALYAAHPFPVTPRK